MKVIFLDIDGVLNHEGMAEQLDEQHRRRGCVNRYSNRDYDTGVHCNCYALENQIDPACVTRLNALIERTGAVVVISSSWRKTFMNFEMQGVLQRFGFKGSVLDNTPDLPNDEEWKEITRGTRWTGHIERGHEIEEWILCHDHSPWGAVGMSTRIDAFCILDDCSDMARVRTCLVQTDDRVGLTDRDAVLAEAAMARSGKVLAEIREEAT